MSQSSAIPALYLGSVLACTFQLFRRCRLAPDLVPHAPVITSLNPRLYYHTVIGLGVVDLKCGGHLQTWASLRVRRGQSIEFQLLFRRCLCLHFSKKLTKLGLELLPPSPPELLPHIAYPHTWVPVRLHLMQVVEKIPRGCPLLHMLSPHC